MNQANPAQLLFEQYLRERGYTFEPIHESQVEGEKTCDYRVETASGDVYVEVEGIVWSPKENFLLDPSHEPWTGDIRKRALDSALHRASKQLKRYAPRPCLIVLHSTAPTVLLFEDEVQAAMFGNETGHGRIVHPHRAKPHVSAVAVVEEFNPYANSKVVRLRVYENRAAGTALPRDVFAGQHDTRWATLADGGTCSQLAGPVEHES